MILIPDTEIGYAIKKHTSPKNFQDYQAASAFPLPSVLQRCVLQSLVDVQEVLRWAQPDNDRLAGSIFLLAIKGLGRVDGDGKEKNGQVTKP